MLSLLHDRVPGLAPEPIGRESGPPVVVMSRAAGAPLQDVLTPAQTDAVVAAYRSLFAVPVPSDLRPRHAPPDQFVADVADWLAEPPPDGLPDVVRRALDAATRWHAAAPAGLGEVRDPVVAQADGNVANLIWDGRRVTLVDFEYAGVGDLAFEVADLVEHASSRLRALLDPAAVLAGFDLTPAQSARVDDYRVVLATFWLLMLLPGSPGHGRNPTGSDERQAAHLLALLAG